MPSTAGVGAPDGIVRPTATTKPATATSLAASTVAAPRGIGLPGFRPVSSGASTRSFRAPIATCTPSIAAPRRAAIGAAPATRRATAPGARATTSDGNGGEGGEGGAGGGAGLRGAGGRGRPATGCEHPFEFRFGQLRRAAEVGDDLDDPAALHDVAHELRDPPIELVVGLVGEALAVL